MLVGIGPQAVADLGVEHFGEAFREAVGERLQEDVGIIVIGVLERAEMRLEPVDPDREAANPVVLSRLMKSARHMLCAALALLHLLAEEGHADTIVAGEHEDVVALAACSATGRRWPSE